MINTLNEPKASWGGSWTEKKLDAFEKYVKAYLTIMEKNPYWHTVYFDAFAGSGEREEKTELYKQLSILEEEERVYQGAAERVVSMDKKFSWYYFIDKDKASSTKLESLLIAKAPELKERFVFRDEDCNSQLLKLAEASSSNKLASLIFLDPFGMQVNWSTIEKLKGTRSDIWILIPTGVIVNRLIDRKGKLTHINKLEQFFGLSEEEIRERFYSTETQQTLFGEDEEVITKVLDPISKIANLYTENLKNIWDHVSHPLRLNNSKGSPIFHFVFASNNIHAKNIAQQIIQKL